jgi:hypothetical protein
MIHYSQRSILHAPAVRMTITLVGSNSTPTLSMARQESPIYLASAALAFEEQAHPLLPAHFDAFDARDNLADILMASAPLSCDELRAAVNTAIREANWEQVPAWATRS